MEDPPFGLLSEAVEALLFWVHPYRWPVIGWMEDLESISLDDVIRYYRDYYRPNNAVLLVCGDVDPEEVLAKADHLFGPIARGPELVPVEVREPEPRGPRTVTVRKPVRLPGVILAWPAPPASSREAKVLNVVEFLLLRGRSSRLYQRLIYKEQLATGLGGGIHLRSGPSNFALRAMARPGVPIRRLRDLFQESLKELATRPVPPEELQKAKNGIEADFIFSLESHHEVGQNLGQDECRSGWREFTRWLDDHQSVTSEEIMRVCAEIFRETRQVVGWLEPEDRDEGSGATVAETTTSEGPHT